jgi:hypothetical protein
VAAGCFLVDLPGLMDFERMLAKSLLGLARRFAIALGLSRAFGLGLRLATGLRLRLAMGFGLVGALGSTGSAFVVTGAAG